ncbi:uncharacterized protein METZ01_LOCUS24998 [marine metagenome]|uniref:Uncharacterized protein n=1 Tax=marine metagenome TaxID=408172 RepID=A0A381PZT7_9ZZZZ
MLFSEEMLKISGSLLFNTPYGSSQISGLHLYCCARLSLRVCLSAHTGHSRGIRELNF